MTGTITISSSYGTEGAVIGREVAARLGLAFFDRAIPVAVAQELAIGTDAAIDMDWHAPGRMERFLDAMAGVSMPYFGLDAQAEVYSNPELFRETTEAVLRKIADGEGGVIVGRGSAIVLADRRDVLRVRLDGPVEARIALTAQRRGVDEAAIRKEQQETDNARDAYLRFFYNVSQYDTRQYQVMLDPTILSNDVCVEIILRAAEEAIGLRAGQGAGGTES